jgi:hypothetical protein
MANLNSDQPDDRIWLAMADSNRTRILSRALAKGMGATVYLGPTMDREGPIALIVADDKHAARIAEARTNAAPAQKSILVTAGTKHTVASDIYLAHDIDAGTLANAIQGLRTVRNYEHARGRGPDLGGVLLGCMTEGAFTLRTRDEAREAAIYLAHGLPRATQLAVGIYVFLSSAIEHGNLEFDAQQKAQGLADGKWEKLIRQRASEPDYAGRRLRVKVQRGGRIFSIIVQDDGPGIDVETAELANPTRTGWRGRLIKLARSLGFNQIGYLGVGNTMEASVLLPAESQEDTRIAV